MRRILAILFIIVIALVAFKFFGKGAHKAADFEEKKSVFIGHAKPVKTAEEAMEFVKDRLEKTKDNEEFLMSMNS